MKNIFTRFLPALAICCLSINSNWAQNTSILSLRLGVNAAKWRTTQAGVKEFPDYNQLRLRYLVSLPFEYNFKTNWSIQIEPSLLQKGARIEYKSTNITTSCEFKASYFELPVLLKFKAGEPNLQLQLFAGPSIGYAILGRITEPKSFINLNQRSPIDIGIEPGSSGYSAFDYSINAGIGMRFRRFGIDARYVLGLKNIGLKGEGNAKYNNQGIQLGLIFRLSKPK